jgi:hypothetical protein
MNKFFRRSAVLAAIALLTVIGLTFAACGKGKSKDSAGDSSSSEAKDDSKSSGKGDGTWTEVADTTFGKVAISAIVYGKDKFVAASADGKMAYSSDGVKWTAVKDSTFGDEDDISAIAYGNNKFVAVGDDGKMAYSPDGIKWTATSNGLSTSSYSAIAYGKDKFVIGGLHGGMLYSSDGVTWTDVEDNPFYKQRITVKKIVYGKDKFVAVGGGAMNKNRYVGKIAYSSDGVNWTDVDSSFDTTADGVIYGTNYTIAYGNGKFIAGGREEMLYSSDGVTWKVLEKSPIRIGGVSYANNKFVAWVSLGTGIAYSSDGVTWTLTDSKFDYGEIAIITYGGGKYVTGGVTGKIRYSKKL